MVSLLCEYVIIVLELQFRGDGCHAQLQYHAGTMPVIER